MQFVKGKSKGFTEADQEQFAEHQIAISHKGHTGLGFKGKNSSKKESNGVAFQGKRIKFDNSSSADTVEDDDSSVFENDKQKLNCIAYKFYMDNNLEEEADSYLEKLKPLTSKQIKTKLNHHVNSILAKTNGAEDSLELAKENEEEIEEKPKKKKKATDEEEFPKKKKQKVEQETEEEEEEKPKKKKQSTVEDEEVETKSGKKYHKNTNQDEEQEDGEEGEEESISNKKRKRQEVQEEDKEDNVEEEQNEEEEQLTKSETKSKHSLKYFKRVEEKDVTFLKDELKDNTYQTLRAKGNNFADAAFKDLGKVKGKDFRAAKTKNKKKTYRGGSINPNQVNSIKFS